MTIITVDTKSLKNISHAICGLLCLMALFCLGGLLHSGTLKNSLYIPRFGAGLNICFGVIMAIMACMIALPPAIRIQRLTLVWWFRTFSVVGMIVVGTSSYILFTTDLKISVSWLRVLCGFVGAILGFTGSILAHRREIRLILKSHLLP